MFLQQDSIFHTWIFWEIEPTFPRLKPKFLFKNDIFKTVKKNWKNSYGFWTINKKIVSIFYFLPVNCFVVYRQHILFEMKSEIDE